MSRSKYLNLAPAHGAQEAEADRVRLRLGGHQQLIRHEQPRGSSASCTSQCVLGAESVAHAGKVGCFLDQLASSHGLLNSIFGIHEVFWALLVVGRSLASR